MSDERFQQLAAKAAHEIEGTPETIAIKHANIRIEAGESEGEFNLIPPKKMAIDVSLDVSGWVVINNKYDQETVIYDDDLDMVIALLQEARRVMGQGGV